jgi:hypothetical protein
VDYIIARNSFNHLVVWELAWFPPNMGGVK